MAVVAVTSLPRRREPAFPRVWIRRLAASRNVRSLLEIFGGIGGVTAIGWLLPLDYHPLGHLYLLAVIVISLRAPLRYAVSAAILSALAWNYIFIPPKMSFAVVDFDGCLLLGTYLFTAVLGSQLTARIQQRNQREALFAQSETMHRVLLNSVSHELKTPLAILRTAVDKLTTADGSRSQILHGEIRIAVTRLDGLVANLLTQNRIQLGRLEAEFDWCDLRDVVFAIRRSLEPLLYHRTLLTEIPEDFPFVFADCHLLEEALYNLVNNALRYTQPDRKIKLRAWESVSDDRIGIIVEDEGSGLDPTYASDVFTPFRRGKNAPPGGLGLGLSIVHGLMLAQNGGVDYSRAPSGGAAFNLWLPRKNFESVPPDES